MQSLEDRQWAMIAGVLGRCLAFDEDKWITVKPNGSSGKGAHVKIGEGGEVKAGLGGKFNGKNIKDVKGGKAAAPKHDVGHRVSFTSPSVVGNGKVVQNKISGIVQKIDDEGRIHIKAQNGGYHKLKPSEITGNAGPVPGEKERIQKFDALMASNKPAAKKVESKVAPAESKPKATAKLEDLDQAKHKRLTELRSKMPPLAMPAEYKDKVNAASEAMKKAINATYANPRDRADAIASTREDLDNVTSEAKQLAAKEWMDKARAQVEQEFSGKSETKAEYASTAKTEPKLTAKQATKKLEALGVTVTPRGDKVEVNGRGFEKPQIFNSPQEAYAAAAGDIQKSAKAAGETIERFTKAASEAEPALKGIDLERAALKKMEEQGIDYTDVSGAWQKIQKPVISANKRRSKEDVVALLEPLQEKFLQAIASGKGIKAAIAAAKPSKELITSQSSNDPAKKWGNWNEWDDEYREILKKHNAAKKAHEQAPTEKTASKLKQWRSEAKAHEDHPNRPSSRVSYASSAR